MRIKQFVNDPAEITILKGKPLEKNVNVIVVWLSVIDDIYQKLKSTSAAQSSKNHRRLNTVTFCSCSVSWCTDDVDCIADYRAAFIRRIQVDIKLKSRCPYSSCNPNLPFSPVLLITAQISKYYYDGTFAIKHRQ
ncbi:hypothetical protein QTP88_008464 [Uroleucon formosanum]